MQGLSFADYPFGELFAPLMPDFAFLFWLWEEEISPFSGLWHDINHAYVDSMTIRVRPYHKIFRPGLLTETVGASAFLEC